MASHRQPRGNSTSPPPSRPSWRKRPIEIRRFFFLCFFFSGSRSHQTRVTPPMHVHIRYSFHDVICGTKPLRSEQLFSAASNRLGTSRARVAVLHNIRAACTREIHRNTDCVDVDSIDTAIALLPPYISLSRNRLISNIPHHADFANAALHGD